MKKIEKVSILLILINSGIWANIYWEKLDLTKFIIGAVSLFVAYFMYYAILRIGVDWFAKVLLKDAVEYFKKNHKMSAMEFSSNFYENIERKFTCYVLIGLLLLDAFALFKFKFSVLSVVNSFIGNNSE